MYKIDQTLEKRRKVTPILQAQLRLSGQRMVRVGSTCAALESSRSKSYHLSFTTLTNRHDLTSSHKHYNRITTGLYNLHLFLTLLQRPAFLLSSAISAHKTFTYLFALRLVFSCFLVHLPYPSWGFAYPQAYIGHHMHCILHPLTFHNRRNLIFDTISFYSVRSYFHYLYFIMCYSPTTALYSRFDSRNIFRSPCTCTLV